MCRASPGTKANAPAFVAKRLPFTDNALKQSADAVESKFKVCLSVEFVRWRHLRPSEAALKGLNGDRFWVKRRSKAI